MNNEKLPSDFLDICKKWRKYKVLWQIGKKGDQLVKKEKKVEF